MALAGVKAFITHSPWDDRKLCAEIWRYVGALKLKRKPVPLTSLPKSGRWKKVVIRHSTKGELVARYRRFSIWLWNQDNAVEPIRVHLIIRKLDGQGKKRFKYLLSYAQESTSIQRLAYQ